MNPWYNVFTFRIDRSGEIVKDDLRPVTALLQAYRLFEDFGWQAFDHGPELAARDLELPNHHQLVIIAACYGAQFALSVNRPLVIL